jgi:hypothetical protein
MELTEEERKNWINHRKHHVKPRKDPEKEKEIIELSKSDLTLKDIKKAVHATNGPINNIRMAARRKRLL